MADKTVKNFKFSQINKHVHLIEHISTYADFNCKMLVCSDIHFDSPQCDREKLEKHFKEADVISIKGDFFDLMQGQYDPRKNYSDIMPQYKGANYLDLVINDAIEFLRPYAHKIAMIGYGNHETGILKRQNTDPISRLVIQLNRELGTNIQIGSYQGFLVFRFRQVKREGTRGTCVIYYHHGNGGNARRSKGILSNQIDGFLAPDADIICKGHDHNKWHDPSNVRLKLDKTYSVVHSAQHVLRLGSYKTSKINHGWEVEKGFLPSKLGGWFVNFTMKEFKLNWDNIQEAV